VYNKRNLWREKINATEQTNGKYNLKMTKKGTELRKTNDTANIYAHFKKLNSVALYFLPILPT
jgi:hypothetical protein